MVPFLVVLGGWLILRALGFVGVQALDNWQAPLRGALALMFVVTAAAHFGSRRRELMATVPTALPAAGVLVTLTGILELLGAAGLLYPPVAPVAAGALAVLLILMFPANVRAARARLPIGGRLATPLRWRAPLQVLFLAALVCAALG